jgi:hypothetical protein
VTGHGASIHTTVVEFTELWDAHYAVAAIVEGTVAKPYNQKALPLNFSMDDPLPVAPPVSKRSYV